MKIVDKKNRIISCSSIDMIHTVESFGCETIGYVRLSSCKPLFVLHRLIPSVEWHSCENSRPPYFHDFYSVAEYGKRWLFNIKSCRLHWIERLLNSKLNLIKCKSLGTHSLNGKVFHTFGFVTFKQPQHGSDLRYLIFSAHWTLKTPYHVK